MLTSDRQKNVAIACYDIGEFCRFHPFGRNVIESLGKKNVIMKLANDPDPNIKENALLALQKIMLHNWNALSKWCDFRKSVKYYKYKRKIIK